MRHRWLLCAGTALVFVLSASDTPAQETTTYTYDALGRLTGADVTGGPASGESTAIQYDPAGNRQNYSVTAAQSGSVVISVANTSVTEGGIAVFNVTKSGTASGTVTVQYATANATADSSDFTSASGTLSFASGDAGKTISVQTTSDSDVEGDETFTLTLSNASSGASIGTATGTGTILNDDSAATVSFSIADAARVPEGSGMIFTVTKSGSGAGSVSFATINDSAIGGSDYTPVSGTLSFTAAQTSKTITVNTINDTTPENNERVEISLSSPSAGATISDGLAYGWIDDDDSSANFWIKSVHSAVTEGNLISFRVVKTGEGAASVNYATTGGSATAGTDYTPVSGTLSFAFDEEEKAVLVSTADDGASESSETVQMTLSSPTNSAIISAGQKEGTILDNETTASTTVSISDAVVTEGNGLQFTLTRSGWSKNFSVDFTAADASARVGSDYGTWTGTVSFSSSNTTKTVTISTLEDSVAEPQEQMLLILSNPTNGVTFTDNTGVGTINDDD